MLTILPRDRQQSGYPGLLASMDNNEQVTRINDRPRAAQSSTITVDTAENSSRYAVLVDGVEVAFTSDGSATAAEIAAGLAAAIVADPVANGIVVATAASAVVTLASRLAGRAFTLTTDDARLTIATPTANAVAADVPFGIAVIDVDRANRLAAVPDGALAPLSTLHVVTLTPAVANSTIYSVVVIVAGVTVSKAITSDGSATAAEIVAALVSALNTDLPANSVLASGTDTLVLTSEVPGQDFVVVPGPTLTAVVTTQGTRIEDVLAGVTVAHEIYEQPRSGAYALPGNSTMPVLRKGEIYVTTEDQVTNIDALVYVRTGSTGQKGGFRSTPAAGCVPLPRSKARWVRRESSTLAVLKLN